MQFRWIVGITLWTCFSGPVFSGVGASSPRPAERPAVAAPERAPQAGHAAPHRR